MMILVANMLNNAYLQAINNTTGVKGTPPKRQWGRGFHIRVNKNIPFLYVEQNNINAEQITQRTLDTKN